MGNVTGAITTTLSAEQREKLTQAATAYIKEIEAVQSRIRKFASELPTRISEAGGDTDEAVFVSEKILEYTQNYDRDIRFIQEQYCDCTEVAASDTSFKGGLWNIDFGETDELRTLRFKANILLADCGLDTIDRAGKAESLRGSNMHRIWNHDISYNKHDGLSGLIRTIDDILSELNKREQPDVSNEIVLCSIPDAVRDISMFIRKSYSIPAANMLADCIDCECTKMSGKNIGVYFVGVKMFVNNESAFAKNHTAFEELNAKLDMIADTHFGNSIMCFGHGKHTVYTSALVRYALFVIKPLCWIPLMTKLYMINYEA